LIEVNKNILNLARQYSKGFVKVKKKKKRCKPLTLKPTGKTTKFKIFLFIWNKIISYYFLLKRFSKISKRNQQNQFNNNNNININIV
jgi:hypothetical protein